MAEWLRGRLAEAERAFVSSLAGWQETDQLTVTVWAAYSLAHVQRSRGRLDAAARTSQRMLDITGTRAGGPGLRPGWRMSAWPRSPTSEMSWTAR